MMHLGEVCDMLLELASVQPLHLFGAWLLILALS